MHTKLLATSSCKHNHVWVYYFSIYLRSIGYRLPIFHFTKSQLETIQQPMTPVILCKLGMCQNLSRILAFLSLYYDGLDLRALFIEQGIGQVEFILQHLCSQSMVSKLPHIILGCFQFHAGVSYCIFLNPETLIPYLKGRWLASSSTSTAL
jgi:hypothetical protein